MKFLSVLLFQFFCSAAPIGSTHTYLKYTPPYQKIFTTQMQRLQPKHLNALPRPPPFRNFFPKFLYWKSLLELECFKDICGGIRHRNYPNKIGHKQISASRDKDRNQNFSRAKVSESPVVKIHPQTKTTIFWSPKILPKKQTIIPVTKQNFSPTAMPRLHSNEYRNKENTTERKDAMETPKHFLEKNFLRRMSPEDKVLLKYITNSNLVEPLAKRKFSESFRPYEVEEILEEKYEIEDDKDEESFKPFERKNEFVRKNQDGVVDENTDHYQNIIGNSVKSILSKLMSPEDKAEPLLRSAPADVLLHLEKPKKGSFSNQINSPRTSSARRVFPSDTFAKNKEENILGGRINQTPRPTFQPNDDYMTTEPFDDWRQKPTEVIQMLKNLLKQDTYTRINNSRRFDFPMFSEIVTTVDYSRLDTEPPSSDVFASGGYNGSRVVEDSEVSLTDTLKSFNFLGNTALYQSDFSTEENGGGNEEETTVQTSTDSFVPTKTDDEIPRRKSTAAEQTMFNEEDELRRTKDFLESIGDFSDTAEEITKRDFEESTDRPISFDLFVTTTKYESKKDPEAASKNSRKMHFGISNEISNVPEAEQRRSDILIADNLADYVDEENNLPLKSYLEKLKQNNSFVFRNLTPEALIPFVSTVVNGLREGKIPSEDFSILSEALGKYWRPILALSNVTNLDMLPLLKMKNEKDLENFLENYFSESSITPGGTSEKSNKADEEYIEMYDYMEQYKDMYKDVLGQEVNEKKKSFRTKRDADDYRQALEARREYFESLEEEMNNEEESHYIFEDIMYDEMLDDYSAFEMKKMTNLQIDPET